jgi:hypothetical protein
MNTKKILQGVLVLALVVGAFILGRSGTNTPFNSVADSVAEQIPGTVANEAETTGTEDTPSGMAPYTGDTSGIPTPPPLPRGQLEMLRSFGIDPATVSVTPAMMACAEAKVGAARLAEIKNGVTPTMVEGAKLVTCYK